MQDVPNVPTVENEPKDEVPVKETPTVDVQEVETPEIEETASILTKILEMLLNLVKSIFKG